MERKTSNILLFVTIFSVFTFPKVTGQDMALVPETGSKTISGTGPETGMVTYLSQEQETGLGLYTDSGLQTEDSLNLDEVIRQVIESQTS